jgi:hypothetical protein
VGSSPTPPLEIRGKITPHKWAINVKREYTHHSIYLFFLFLWFLISVCYRKFSAFLSEQEKKQLLLQEAGLKVPESLI